MKVRIEGHGDPPTGYHVKITDMETGKIVPGVFKAVVTLEATGRNQVELTYYETDTSGQMIVGSDNQPVEYTTVVEDPVLDLAAIITRWMVRK